MAENYTQPAAQAANDAQDTEHRELTIKFGKGLVGDPFTSRAGTELSEIKIPNVDPNDHRARESFVVPEVPGKRDTLQAADGSAGGRAPVQIG